MLDGSEIGMFISSIHGVWLLCYRRWCVVFFLLVIDLSGDGVCLICVNRRVLKGRRGGGGEGGKTEGVI